MKLDFARPDDESQVKQLLAECELPHEDITPAHLRHFWVLWDDSHLAGVIGLEMLGRFALLRSLAVPVAYRGRGIASRLTLEAEEYAHSHGVEALYLLTTTADGFFARHGYQRIDRGTVPSSVRRTAEFQSICPSSAICMVKRLLFLRRGQ